MIQTSSNLALLTGSEICLENPRERKNPGGYGVLQIRQMSHMRSVKVRAQGLGQSHPKGF